MERKNKFFGLGKTLAAGALALAMVPGSALATATFDGFALANLSLEYDAPINSLGGAVDQDDAFTDEQANATALILADFVSADDFGASHDVQIQGEANPTGSGSVASAGVFTSTSVLLENTGTGDASVFAAFDWFALASATLDDLVNESAGVSVSIVLGTLDFFTGVTTELVNESIDLLTAGGDSLSGQFSEELVVGAGEFLGLYVDVNVEGIAISVRDPGQGVPVPATLALLALGFIGLAARRKVAA